MPGNGLKARDNMTEEHFSFKRLSIGINSGSSVLTVTQSAKNLSEALSQELDYFKRGKRIPSQINISRED